MKELVGPGPLLLDFDGPICSMFAGLPAARVADGLVKLIGTPTPAELVDVEDPLAVLRWAGDHGSPTLTEAVEKALVVAERDAADSAAPTPFASEVLAAARTRGLPVAVVSNNSAPAIEVYLRKHNLEKYVEVIVGREPAAPWRMKPDPGSVLAAVEAVGSTPARCTLIGDSLTDIEAARAAGTAVIGYANRPWKLSAFRTADAVVTSMGEVAAALPPA